LAAAQPSPAIASPGTSTLPRLELRIERLQLRFRFTFAFHAREVRFEAARGDGDYERVFPETFSFHVARHDPTELFIQLEDLLTKAQVLSPRASARDARNLMSRMLASAPRYLDGLCEHLVADGGLRPEAACASTRTSRCWPRSCCDSSRPTTSARTASCDWRPTPSGAASTSRCAC
jgi:hypothetical protein